MYKLLIIFFLFFNAFAKNIQLTNEEKDWIKTHPIITLGSDTSWSPYIIKNSDGSLSGYDKDILNLINEKTGANFQLVVGQWKQMLHKAKNREIDGLSTSAIHKERSRYYNFSIPYASTKRLLIVSNNNPKNIKSIDDLKNKKLSFQEKNLFDKKIISNYSDAIHVPLQSLDEILTNLIIGKVDATIGSHALLYLAKKRKLPYLKIVDFIPNSKLDLVFSIRNDYPLALSILNKGLNSISDEKKNNLFNKWFFNSQNDFALKNKLNLTKEEKEYLNNNPILKVSNLSSFPPFNFYENNMPLGYTIDYMKLFEKYLDVKFEFISNKSWSEFLAMLKTHKLDIIPHIAITPERKKFVSFTSFNHIQYTTGVAIRKDLNISSIFDLKNKIIAVTNKSFIHSYLKKNFPHQSLLLTNSTNKALNAVSLGQADAVIGSLPVLEYYIQKDWLSNIKTTKINDLNISTKTELPMGVSKDNLILKNILEKTNSSISHSEVIKLKEKWMNVKVKDNSSILFNKNETQYLNSKKDIKMCIDPDWMPFEKNDKGRHIGMAADYIELLQKHIPLPIKFVETKNWIESVKYGEHRKCDILSLAMSTIERKNSFVLTKPYLSVPLVIATSINQPFINDISLISDKKIGIVNGYAYGDILKEKYPKIKLVHVQSIKEGLNKVRDEKLFALIGTLPVLGYNIQKDHIGELKIAGKFKDNWNLGIGIRADEPILKDIFNKAINTLSSDEHRKILNKWISVNYEKEMNYDSLLQLGGVFFIILLLILYRNRSVEKLNKKLKDANNAIIEQQLMVDKYVMILSTNLEGVIIDVNSAYCSATGYLKEELLSNNHEVMRHPDMKKEFFKEMWESINKNEIWKGEIKNFTKERKEIFFNVNIEPIFKDDKKIGYRSISEDITDKKRIEKLSVTDKLTGLYNRLKLDEVLVKRVESYNRYNTQFSIILLDIDDFKKVNDNYGHDIGDKVLQELSELLKKNTRLLDTIGRWGGEEFVIVCESTNLDNAYIFAENLRKKILNFSFTSVGKKTVSLGVAQFTKDDTLTTIFKKVDEALYKAKHNGKNQTIKYDK